MAGSSRRGVTTARFEAGSVQACRLVEGDDGSNDFSSGSVANGNGGVQVVDLSDLSSPYRVGFIKPNGFARDVAVKDHFIYIAASHEGVVVADIADPAMPIISTLDTLGVATA